MKQIYSNTKFFINLNIFARYKMDRVSELTPSLTVTELKINVSDLDLVQLGEKLQPTNKVVAINSCFIHKAFDGYEHFLSKRKVEKKVIGPISKRGRKRAGDGTVFNACIEFTIIVDDDGNTKIVRLFPKSGTVQIFSTTEPVNIFMQYLRASNLPEFANVDFVGDSKPLLLNYKFSIILENNKIINLYSLARSLREDNVIRDLSPFPILYIKCDDGDVHHKIAIVFSDKIRVHIWPKSGKINIFGAKAELTAILIYEFIQGIFSNRWDDFMCDFPIRYENE